ncbi:limonene hydroxylase [Paenibacillus sp. CAA11]|nr:limonene hydroxylase [Paenibacillus sp. CAA11]
MMQWFKRKNELPWEGRPSIYAYICDKIREQDGPLEGDLPDDEEFWAGDKMRLVAGGMDGIIAHHGAGSDPDKDIQELLNLLVQQTQSPSDQTRKATYEKLIQDQLLISNIDTILRGIRETSGIKPGPLYYEAKWFAEHGAHRNVVKFGIALLGLFDSQSAEAVQELIFTLGRHDEFTLYAVVAIQNGLENSNDTLFKLAQKVDGWGKIHIVERLEPNSQKIKDWLLRDGCQNRIMDEYLAWTCAMNGELHAALTAQELDQELFEGATDILQALLNGGPAEEMDDYEYASAAITAYLRHAAQRELSLKHLLTLIDLKDYLEEEDPDRWEHRMETGWTAELRQDGLAVCVKLISLPDWTGKILHTLKQSDGTGAEHYYAVTCARRLGMDIWELLFDRLSRNPLEASLYQELMKSQERERIGKLVQFAEAHLPLQEIATGPADETGFGPGFESHRCLVSILQSLGAYEGLGKKLIFTGLNSPVMNNRNMAVKALESWELAVWGDGITNALAELSAKEPNETVKESIRQLKEAKGI